MNNFEGDVAESIGFKNFNVAVKKFLLFEKFPTPVIANLVVEQKQWAYFPPLGAVSFTWGEDQLMLSY